MSATAAVFFIWMGGALQQALIGSFLIDDEDHRSHSENWPGPFDRFPVWGINLVCAAIWPVTLLHTILTNDEEGPL